MVSCVICSYLFLSFNNSVSLFLYCVIIKIPPTLSESVKIIFLLLNEPLKACHLGKE